MKKFFLIYFLSSFFLLNSSIYAKDSITGRFGGYRAICEKASKDPYYLQNFRSIGEYRIALELPQGDAFADYISHSPTSLKNLNLFRKLDTVGNPTIVTYPTVGAFSATTLRYIVIADQIKKFFKLPKNAKIAEIGAGFGGQCFVLSQIHPISQYYIYDLPEVEALISKVTEVLSVPNVHCLPIDSPFPEEKIDLVISNYAFSECDRDMQMEYFEKVIKKADRGFLIYNQISKSFYGIESLSPAEFVELLKKNGARPKTLKEFPSTAPDNLLIIWDKTHR